MKLKLVVFLICCGLYSVAQTNRYMPINTAFAVDYDQEDEYSYWGFDTHKYIVSGDSNIFDISRYADFSPSVKSSLPGIYHERRRGLNTQFGNTIIESDSEIVFVYVSDSITQLRDATFTLEKSKVINHTWVGLRTKELTIQVKVINSTDTSIHYEATVIEKQTWETVKFPITVVKDFGLQTFFPLGSLLTGSLRFKDARSFAVERFTEKSYDEFTAPSKGSIVEFTDYTYGFVPGFIYDRLKYYLSYRYECVLVNDSFSVWDVVSYSSMEPKAELKHLKDTVYRDTSSDIFLFTPYKDYGTFSTHRIRKYCGGWIIKADSSKGYWRHHPDKDLLYQGDLVETGKYITTHIEGLPFSDYQEYRTYGIRRRTINYYRLSDSCKMGDENFRFTSVSNYQESNLNVYPNPASSVINIPQFKGKVTCYDLNGKRKRIKLVDKFQYDVSDLTSGTYVLHFQTDTEIQTKKLVIVR